MLVRLHAVGEEMLHTTRRMYETFAESKPLHREGSLDPDDDIMALLYPTPEEERTRRCETPGDTSTTGDWPSITSDGRQTPETMVYNDSLQDWIPAGARTPESMTYHPASESGFLCSLNAQKEAP
jgi:hypothetical protein